ncbi:SRPBCC family protein [Saccharopolyspora shandongensis]|uniref:SRPBCC family protein n=1 Tax=Saccharopolyspora shandongensis TaxID=418495 RepID=UPI003432C600
MSGIDPSTSPNQQARPRRRRGARAALLAIPLAAGILGAIVIPTLAGTGGHTAGPDSLTCQGEGVDPTAKVRYRTETFIRAPLSTVWKLQTDVASWPSWQQPVSSAERLDPDSFRKHSQFRWTTPVPPTPANPATALVITSTVQQLQRDKCIRWTGPAIGEGLQIDGVHVWNFTEVDGGVLVRTEETHTGPQVDANVPLATDHLGQGLEAWLTALKTTAESGQYRPTDNT